jgi:hypothetical protein
MRGKKTDPRLVDEIRELRRVNRPAEIVRMMDGRLHRRTVYRILARLRREEEERRREDAERVRRALEREEAERIRRARTRGAKRFTSVAQLPANLRKVRSV